MLPTTIEYASQRTLTTQQIADAYQVEAKSLLRNFQRNRKAFIQGEHYYALTGDELKRFKASRQNDATLKFISTLYLWTEKGAWQFAKSLRTEAASRAFQLLMSQCFTKPSEYAPQTAALITSPEYIVAIEHRVSHLEQELRKATIHTGEQKRVQNAVRQRVQVLSTSHAQQAKLYPKLYHALKKTYQVSSYRDICRVDLPEAMRFIAHWQL